jgi:hypothetical protein
VKETKSKYNFSQKIHACFMIMALLFLTVSAPLTLNAQSLNDISTEQTDTSADDTNPFGNNTEEKVPSSNNLAEEYLHDSSDATMLSGNNASRFVSFDVEIFIDYHHELLVPPPNLG